MNNHTTSILAFILVFCSSVMLNTPVSHGQLATNPSQGKGLIRISDAADIAIYDTTVDSSTPEHTQQSTIIPAPDNAKVMTTKRKDKGQPAFNSIITSNLVKVHEVAKPFGHQETMQAILLQESGGGNGRPVIGNPKAPITQRSYGLMQVQIGAARSMMKRHQTIMDQYFAGKPAYKVTDKEVMNVLLHNDEANIEIAVRHFDLYMSLSKGNWNKAVAAYNMGIGNANKRSKFDDLPYVRSIKTRLNNMVKPFNKQYADQLTL